MSGRKLARFPRQDISLPTRVVKDWEMATMNVSPITLTERDHERLLELVQSDAAREIPGVDMLRSELDRANIVDSKEIDPDVVTMNSTVLFVEEGGDKTHQLKLVYPHQAGQAGTVSILAPVGSALLGLSVGQTIHWQASGRRDLTLRVVSVVDQPESKGKFHL
jgi:regulator of nucleoside diphosphate kinase